MRRQQMNRITLLLLLIGFGSACAIYLTANTAATDPQLADLLTTKKYQREMQMIAGEANVAASEFQAWFAAQWQGKALARTVAILTVVVTLAFRFVASHPDYAVADPVDDQ
jgi:hypothetical protein